MGAMNLIKKLYKPRHAKLDLEKKYKIGEELGQGNFAVVKKCTDRKTGKTYAVKIIDKSLCEGKEEMIETEVQLLRQVNHKNIVGLVEEFDTPKNLYLVLDYVSGGELFERIVDKGSYTEKDASRIVRQMTEAVGYLHAKNIVHRDLKPENLLFASPAEDSEILVADFGLSKLVSDASVLSTACGTPNYVAPEILRQGGYSKPVDVWSLGIITFILLCGYPPFYDDNDTRLFKLIMKGHFEFQSPYWDDVGESAKDLIKQMLQVDPAKRLTADQVLSHPWITGETATEASLGSNFSTNYKNYKAKRRFKAAARGVIMTNLMKRISMTPNADAATDSPE